MIHHALTVSLTIYTSYIEQFWNTASSQTINDEKQIHATVDSKAVVVTYASIGSYLLFNDVDGTAFLTNDAIFHNLTLMGYEDNPKKKFLMYPRFLMVFLNNQIELGEPFNDVYIAPTHTLKVFSNMSRKGLKFLGKITQLFLNMLIQAEGKGSGVPTKPQPTPSPTHPSTGDQPPVTESSSSHDTTQDSGDSLEGTNRSEWDQDAQAIETIALKARIKKLEKRCKPSILHHRAWLKSVHRLSMKKRIRKKESVSKHRRKKDKLGPNLDDSTLDDLDVDHGMDIEEPMNQERLSEETKELGSTARPEDSTVRPDVGTADPIVPLTTTTSIFDDEDITMAQTLIKMKEEKAKEKRVSIKDIEDFSRPARSILTLKPLSTIDPKDKGKDAEVARLVYEEELAELEREKKKRQRGEEASKPSSNRKKEKSIQLKREQSSWLKQLLLKENSELHKDLLRLELKAKTFAKIQGLYERQKKVIDDCKPMDSDAVEKEKVLKEPDNTKIEKEGIHLKKTLKRMLALRLIAECESKAVFDLLRFIQKQIDESESHDGSEKDLAPCYYNEALAIPEQTTTDDQDWKLIKEKFKKFQCVWIHSRGVQEAQDEET
nr:hypothetical protein [Tanacetum cinerariifolium]